MGVPWIGIIAAIVLSLFYFEVSAQSPMDIEQRARRLEEGLQGTADLNKLMETYREAMQLMDKANRKTGGITGMQNIPTQPAETPEKEMERRREIINSQFHQAKNMMSNLPAGTEKPQIPEAFPLEGYIVVNGGEKEFFSNEVTMDLLYTIKESFVGNLILHAYDATRGQFDREKGYEIQSLSTKINVSSVAGKKCVRRSYYSPSSCTRWTHFLRYDIDKGERYPQFRAGVVSTIPAKNGQVKVMANAPAVTFLGDDGKTNLGMGCFNATWALNRSEFEQLLKRGEISLHKDISRPMGGPSPGCRPGSTMTLHLKVRQEPEECKDMRSVELMIVSPEDKSGYVFSDEYLLSEHSNKLTLELEARTVPERYADSVEWTIPEIEGSNRTIIPASTSPTLKGQKLTVVYKGLPKDNNEFGRKTVKAALKVNSCKIEKTREVRFFYPRDEKNNPEGKHPNWYYYWKQTPAARPFAQNVRIEYHCAGIPIEKCTCLQRGVIGQYNPYYSGYKTINVCNLRTNTWNPDTFYAELPAVKRSKPSTLSERNYSPYTYIDTFAVAVMHEFTHFNNFHAFWPEGWKESEDSDEDDIPDRLESEMGFRPDMKQTYWREVDLSGDEELLTLEATYDYQVGTYDEYDWAKPGKNWPK
ncbi:MAG: hypothetical protein A4E62_02545 [Syntrophorhabdus sp. PtaU1.Bin002]|nr:MAG: hypothetical protein A4E62_02545 [Syntrophorhabdus sp. PtaU1.Bin002]